MCIVILVNEHHDLVQTLNTQETLADGGEIESEDEDMFYLRRLEGGLFTLQTVDYILAWVVMEDDGVSNIFRQLVIAKSSTTPDSRPCHTNA